MSAADSWTLRIARFRSRYLLFWGSFVFMHTSNDR